MEELLNIRGKTYLITGAASGIGRSIAILLSSFGAKLILLDKNKEGLVDAAKKCISDIYLIEYDLLDHTTLKESIISASKDFAKIDGFVHVAGIPYISPLKSISAELCDKVYKINTYSAIELAKICTNRNVLSGEGGSIVFISSVYGLVGSSANVGYAMSKSALIGITKSLAIELAPKNIRVNCVAPGFIATDMLSKVSNSFDANYTSNLDSLHPLGLGKAEDIANSVLFLLSDMAKWITGTILSVDGGFTAK